LWPFVRRIRDAHAMLGHCVLCPDRAAPAIIVGAARFGARRFPRRCPDVEPAAAKELERMLTKPEVRTASEVVATDGVEARTTAGSKPKSSIRQRLERLFADYGRVAIVTYFTIFFLTLGGFAIVITLGMHTDGTVGWAATLGAAWLATKVTQIPRIGATVVLTPVAARVWHRVRPRSARVVAVSEPASEESQS
jgi:hypothetical protein